ncbi:hypothetical protein HOU02_gp240 [Caulobacter phage CcrBL9]|uniref:Major capsid protein n=1 Tax=Caulobacter phage CcrBL9 TaxID=2283270 RepID=A0A385EEN3_9CAUD|nr:hypothetical protein HOU02_gp240 [Caulobacter phage CcrBL9]AXQ69485.1 hypothetical protein CcrBL9_gp461 [Caulobacter phage CcrBL9]
MPQTMNDLLEAVPAGSLERHLLNQMQDKSMLLREATYLKLAGDQYTYIQEGWLPGVAFMGASETPSSGDGVLNPRSETLIPYVQRDEHLPRLIERDVIIGGNGDGFGLYDRLLPLQIIKAPDNVFTPADLQATIDAVDGPTHVYMTQGKFDALVAAEVIVDGRLVDNEDLGILIASDGLGLNYAEIDHAIVVLNMGEAGVVILYNDPPYVEDQFAAWDVSLAVMSGRAVARYEDVKIIEPAVALV